MEENPRRGGGWHRRTESQSDGTQLALPSGWKQEEPRLIPSPRSSTDALIRLHDYERVLLKKLNSIDHNALVDPPVFEWDGTVVNFVDMLEFAKLAIPMAERQIRESYMRMDLKPEIESAMVATAQSTRELARIRESIDEIEYIASRCIRSPRWDQVRAC